MAVSGSTPRVGRRSAPQLKRIQADLIIDRDGAPAAALPNEEFATKDSELLACDVECRLAGIEGFYLELEIPGLDELIGGDR